VPYLLIILASQSVLYFERYLASLLDEGSVSGLNYAYRLAQFPNWVFAAAIGTVILPAMSKSQGLGNTHEMQSMFDKSLRWILILSAPVSILLYGLREPIVSIFLQRGAFDAVSMGLTTDVLKGYSLAIVAQSIAIIGLRVFIASGKMFFPLFSFFFSSTVNIIADLFLINHLGLSALGYGAAIGAIINAVLIIYGLKNNLGLNIRSTVVSLFKVFLSCIPVIIVVMLSNLIRHSFAANFSFFTQLFFIIATIVPCFILYMLILTLCKGIKDNV
jgi:peptidoglycan biosynthesis protein MviN/MurJ (putative lipid II flippase)